MPGAHKLTPLEQLELPRNLIELIRQGRLHAEIAKAEARWAALSARLDLVEAAYPDWAAQLPWWSEREAWKAAGRPKPEWWELLRQFGPLDADRACYNLVIWPAKYESEKNRKVCQMHQRTYGRRKHGAPPERWRRRD